jgi:hypothetical protein
MGRQVDMRMKRKTVSMLVRPMAQGKSGEMSSRFDFPAKEKFKSDLY